MNFTKNKKMAGFILASFAVIGIYNAVVFNSDSSISDVKFVKRLDEVYGVTTPGRKVASNVTWQKLEKKAVVENEVVADRIEVVETAPVATAAITKSLNLNLVQVENIKNANEFSGTIVTSNGVIDSLNIELPEGKEIFLSSANMNGNVFEYTQDGEVRSGLFYQVEKNKYMITLSNGPFEGARFTFSKGAKVESLVDLAQNNTNVGTFGSEVAPEMMNVEVSAQDLPLQATSYNLDQGVL